MINELIQEYLDKPIIRERVSSIVYHFTTVGAIWVIIKNNRIYLSSALETRSDDLDKNKKFFLSLTRQRNGNLGYSKSKPVRITLDGDMLNNNFKGGAFDYWGDSMGKQFYYRDMQQYGRRDSFQSRTENEDRILSEKPYIDNILAYVKRIDIIYDGKNKMEFPYIYQMVSLGSQMIHIYNNQKDFNYQTENTINQEILATGNYGEDVPKSDTKIDKIGFIGSCLYKILTFILMYETEGDYSKEYGILLRKYDLDKYINSVYKCYQKDRGYSNLDFDISYLLKDLRRNNIDVCTKASQMVADFFKRNKLRNEREAKIALNQKFAKKYKRVSYDWDKQLKFLVFINYNGGKTVILKPNTTSFWTIVDKNVRRFFIEDIVNAIRSHKSKDDESFKKYLKHLTMNNISVSEMMNILNKLDVDDYVIPQLINGNFEYRNLTYSDDWKYKFISEEEHQEFMEMFEIEDLN